MNRKDQLKIWQVWLAVSTRMTTKWVKWPAEKLSLIISKMTMRQNARSWFLIALKERSKHNPSMGSRVTVSYPYWCKRRGGKMEQSGKTQFFNHCWPLHFAPSVHLDSRFAQVSHKEKHWKNIACYSAVPLCHAVLFCPARPYQSNNLAYIDKTLHVSCQGFMWPSTFAELTIHRCTMTTEAHPLWHSPIRYTSHQTNFRDKYIHIFLIIKSTVRKQTTFCVSFWSSSLPRGEKKNWKSVYTSGSARELELYELCYRAATKKGLSDRR